MSELEAESLTYSYREHVVLRGVSLAAAAGEVLALLGPNGSGKTTLLRGLGRLLRPAHGRVFLEGHDLWRLSPAEATRGVSLTPQAERRDWPLSVEEAVSLGRVPHRGWYLPFTRADRDEVERALELTGLAGLRRRPITELSGGEWRRAVLARALAQRARVMLLDEPLSGLDLKYQTAMLQLIRSLAADSGLVVVLTLHDLNQAALFADRVVLLGERSVLASGPPAEVLTAERIGRAYGVSVTVVRHPVYGTPLVAPLVE